jgi:alpha-ketoglutarate-dependent taurine dioxygenase
MSLEVHPLQPFGFEAEVSLLPAPGSAEARQLRAAYRQDGLLIVRGLRLSHQEQIAFCRLFGPVCETPYENFLVSNVDANGHLGTRELLWHNDVAYLPSPYLAACLHALRVDPEAVGTRLASGFRAYERLPDALRRRIAGLKALHIRERVYDRPNRLTDLEEGDMCTVHDVVRSDPETGRKYVFVNQAWTPQVIGLAEAESQDLLRELQQYLYADDNIYEHKWAEGDIVLWDNLALQHARGQAGHGVRTLQRVTITNLSYAEQYPTDLGINASLSNREMLSPSAAA